MSDFRSIFLVPRSQMDMRHSYLPALYIDQQLDAPIIFGEKNNNGGGAPV